MKPKCLHVEFEKQYRCKCRNGVFGHIKIINSKHGRGECDGYFGVVHEYCCEPMRLAIEDEFISIGEMCGYLSRLPTVNIVHANCYDGDMSYENCNILHCPFCGAKIKIEVKR